jgi:enterochelin esterase-like enzyme
VTYCIARLLVCVLAVILIASEALVGQRRGGAPPGPGAPGRGARATAGTIERVSVHGKSLEGGSPAESPDRDVLVYLPPSYGADQARRFPTLYLLHGAAERENAFTEVLARLGDSADRLARAQGFSEFIVVTPNAAVQGSLYATSPKTGDWERFIGDDLVAAVDGRYRTLVHRMSRGLAGHDAGAGAALRIGMKRPEVFANLYLMGAAVDGAVLSELEKYATNLNAYYAIAIDIGNVDALLERNRQLHAAMTKLRIPHTFEEYDGDRANRLRDRIEWNVLPFFARNLAAPANLTSPSAAADRLSTAVK